ncbi:MAG: NADH-quinone oxidoreductase subunit K [Thermoproteota archaeon]|nr:NADH-quinone oxidoreductase subunit K [Candidatus Brockarchaeota archaeon]
MFLYIILSLFFLFFGAYCVVVKRNFLKILIGVELMLSGANLAFIVLSLGSTISQTFVIISLLIGTIFSAASIALAISIYRQCKTLDVEVCKQEDD